MIRDPDGLSAPFVGCTIATVGYLPGARVLADSWRREHPSSPFLVLMVDAEDPPSESELFEVVRPHELGLPPEEVAVQMGIYEAAELSTALKPHLLRHLLDEGAPAVVFCDSDSDVYAPLDQMAEAAIKSGLALTPHVLGPIPGDGRTPTQVEFQQASTGLFNTGLLAVGAGGRAFLDWWGACLARDCLFEPAAGMWVEQRWTDWVPAYFDHVILRDSSLNVAFWNLHERPLHELDGRPAVAGVPLRHFHFSGFDPRRPERLSAYLDHFPRPFEIAYGDPLTRLLQDYADRLMNCGYEGLRVHPYGYERSARGRQLGARERAIYREAVLAAEARGADLPPSPFDLSRIEDFERLVDDPSSLRSLSPQARKRLGHVRRPGLFRFSLSRLSRRLLPAARYALRGQVPPDLVALTRAASDIVRLEY